MGFRYRQTKTNRRLLMEAPETWKLKYYSKVVRADTMEPYLHSFLTSTLVVGEWLASHPRCFTPTKRAPNTH
jgi:hypothetical protein